MIAVLSVDLDEQTWIADPISASDELEPADAIRDYLAFAVQWQALLGGGQMLVLIPDRL